MRRTPEDIHWWFRRACVQCRHLSPVAAWVHSLPAREAGRNPWFRQQPRPAETTGFARSGAGGAGMSVASSSSCRPGDGELQGDNDGLPGELEPLSRRIAWFLRYPRVRYGLFMDENGWCSMTDLLKFTSGWTDTQVECVVALSSGRRGKRFEAQSGPGGEMKVRATRLPPRRRRPTPPELRRTAENSEKEVVHAAPASTQASAVAAEAVETLLPPTTEDEDTDDQDVAAGAAEVVAAPRTPERLSARRSESSEWRWWQAMQDGSGVVWKCEADTTVRFREDSPAPWMLYQDPQQRDPENQPRLYWHNETTKEWFWRCPF